MLSESELYSGMHLVTADGVVHSAGDAANELRAVLAGRDRPGSGAGRWVVGMVYAWVAAHRRFVGRLLPHREAIRVVRSHGMTETRTASFRFGRRHAR